VTGLIYIVIIALWAAVLIPIWLRRHDQISEVRSTARFQSAMSTLGRRHMQRVSAKRQAARRRATVLAVLTLMLATTLALGIAGMTPIWLAFVAAALVLGFVVAAALTANQRSVRRVVDTVREDEAHEEIVEEDVVVRVPATSTESAKRERRPIRTLEDEDEWLKWNAWDDDDAWEAVPQTLPSYVSAPRASAVPRGIDRAHEGEWTGRAMVDMARSTRRVVAEEPIVDYGASTTEIPAVDDRRAVNE
jgi:hypothetical protein